MAGFRRPPPPEVKFPFKTLVYDMHRPARIGLLVSYGTRSARVTFTGKGHGEWVKIKNLKAATKEDLAKALAREAEDLV